MVVGVQGLLLVLSLKNNVWYQVFELELVGCKASALTPVLSLLRRNPHPDYLRM